jgi:hypothetical protein
MKELQSSPNWSHSRLVFCAAVIWWPAAALAAGEVQDVNQLKAELQAQKQRQAELEDKINQLEARQNLRERQVQEQLAQVEAKTPQAPAPEPAGLPDSLKWLEKIKISGDLRYRYEFIDDDSAAGDRHRNRIRARIGLEAKVSDQWNLGLRLATGQGEVSGDPVSTNQTLDEAFSKKPVWLDLAYLGYHPTWLKGLDVYAGKIENPFYKPGKNELIWDNDLTPEGGALLYSRPLGDRTTANLVTGGFWVNEESTGGDTSLWGIQGSLRHQIHKPTYVLGGASWYDYGNIQGEESLAAQWDADTGAFFGNLSVGDTFASDFDLLELFVEFGTEVGGLPVAVFGDWVQNTAAVDSREDTGWLIGGILNKAKDPGSWQFEYDYRDIERNAVVGQFNSSDFLGGGTGGKGHRFAFSYMLTKNVAPALTYFRNQYDGRKNDADYDRLQADILVKF